MNTQHSLIDKLKQASAAYVTSSLRPFLPRVQWTAREEVSTTLRAWAEAYNKLYSEIPDQEPVVLQSETIYGLLADLRDDMQKSQKLRFPWPLCRHVISLALIFRMSERFMDHLERNYAVADAWSASHTTQPAIYKVSGKVNIPLEFDKNSQEPRSVFENDVYWYHRYRFELIQKFRERVYPPFTLARILELLLISDDSSWQQNFWKWCVALSKNVLDPSTSYPQSATSPQELLDAQCMRQIYAKYDLDCPRRIEDYILL